MEITALQGGDDRFRSIRLASLSLTSGPWDHQAHLHPAFGLRSSDSFAGVSAVQGAVSGTLSSPSCQRCRQCSTARRMTLLPGAKPSQELAGDGGRAPESEVGVRAHSGRATLSHQAIRFVSWWLRFVPNIPLS